VGTADRLSGGRLVLGAGLGFTLPAEFGTWGEPTEPRVVAQRLDESLAVLAGLWSGERVDFHGEQVTASDVRFRPVPVQRPRPPVWIGCNWPNRRPLRRAAQWDGVVPQILGPDGSWQPTPAAVSEIVAAVSEQQAGGQQVRGQQAGGQRSGGAPFDVVITGRTQPDQPSAAREVTGAIAAAGATWWLEGFRPQPGERDAARRRIEVGPPS
jgi:alkanesulfonate monooxygenase SsuD/methylene tetrahydromethanopterin reductase-like flavin-dependent oxidoreductase (luciferase family)